MNELKLDNKPVEKLFYKFRPINQHLFDTLEYNELYFRDPRDYNDPVDSVVDGYYEGTFEEFIDYMIKKGGMSREVAVNNMVVGIALGDYQITGNKFKRTAPKKRLHFDIPHIPTYCLSEENKDVTMWSHYADHHKGVCLSFKAKYGPIPEYGEEGYGLTINSERIPIVEMTYDGKMPDPINLLDINGKQLMQFLSTKGSCWEYEKEYRMFLFEEANEQNQNIKRCTFEKTELEGIIFGLNVKKCDALKIYRIIHKNYNDVPFNFYKVQKVENGYEIRIKPICKTGIDEYLESLSD
ncbi:hypothetical protein MSSIT_1789 [Methanosarcina siciliae T4/M]|uniref:DUF2971 domain-containing protein n=1 Tax=Methanosarcina siciliae T4/M TaxID=1434120 RepID=A0A0E3P4G6_9EURY|nr:DUF2971 domain-containing protein [Methanosarcina siciliae]AKB28508.1 hypothetical protein MSSIT_1789 [Methanosarcina siciliae T4/M]